MHPAARGNALQGSHFFAERAAHITDKGQLQGEKSAITALFCRA
ncbi:hypothetical protein V462_01075 [Pantoea ananatis 15320]|nr:hypothetical protein L585_01800 [Pantoea ananatis BRT175]PKC41366.1 hypothetical protein V462_01075 [Pantoea ananatis 15320]CRH27747.1 Uncharacterized protein {ECO:0000313/EMBL:CCF11535.1} [Pantoea ananatis]CRH32118.1 Uncharacterized protein BN1183_AC_00620 [Pantoea ananatis]